MPRRSGAVQMPITTKVLLSMSRLYDKRRWHRTRRRQLMREPLCRVCHAFGLIVVASDVDHVVPLTSGGAEFDPDNLQSLCKLHHTEKTNCETHGREWKPTRVRGCNVDGSPIIAVFEK